MGILLSDDELARLEPADEAAFRSPVPTQIVSNGEFNPLPQTRQQKQVEDRIKEIADAQSLRLASTAASSCAAPPAWPRRSSP